MILETIEILQLLADIIGVILVILQPVVVPIGQVMVFIVNNLLGFFPTSSLTFYIILFIIFVIAGIIANTSLVGDRLKNKFNKFDEKQFKKHSKHIPEDTEDAFKIMEKKKKSTDTARDNPENKDI